MPNGKLKIAKSQTITTLGEPSLAGMGGKFQTNLHQDHRAEELFTAHGPQVGDVNQQAIGDCWYLASIIAILSRPFGPEWFEHALVDNLDGTVTVRLFDVGRTAHYIRVRKSLAVGASSMLYSSRLYHSKGALWVAMLEKALTAFDEEGRFDATHAAYRRTSGNDPALAYALLINRKRDVLQEETIEDPKQRQATDYRLTFKTAKGWKASTQVEWEKLVAARRKADKVLRLENFHAFFSKQDVSAVAPEEMKRILGIASVELAGKRFTGNYPSTHLLLYDMLERCAVLQQPVVAYTRKTVGRTQNFMGISANEPVSKGLAGDHAYAVLGTIMESTIRYVVFVNPWGQTGRGYGGNKKPVAIQSGTFRLELDDAVKRFRGFYATKALSRDDLENQAAADSGVPRKKPVEKAVVVRVQPRPPQRVPTSSVERPLLTELAEIRFSLAGLMNLPSPEMEFSQARGYAKKWMVKHHPDKHQDKGKEELEQLTEQTQLVLKLLKAWEELQTSGARPSQPVLMIKDSPEPRDSKAL